MFVYKTLLLVDNVLPQESGRQATIRKCSICKMAFLCYHPLIHSEYTCVLLISNIQVISVITLLAFGVKIPNGSVYFFHSILWGKFTEIF
jgi:hypothetical protein